MQPQAKEKEAVTGRAGGAFAAADPGFGIYCHVPFCASSCDFCAFYQEKPNRADLEDYLGVMDLEFSLLPRDRPVETVFWGGGTPGLLPARDLERMGRSLLRNISGPPREWTVEMAPSTVKADKLRALRDLGVTRISMGVQTFHAPLLEALGRLHRPPQIYAAWERIVAAGFPHRNIDLIFALPGQSLQQWESDVREAVRLGPDHISAYCLTFEEDTALYVKLARGQLAIDREKETRFYERGWDLLEELGFGQYEISNFSRPGGCCLHNWNTWRMGEWIGCGPSAASQFRRERYQRPADLKEWSRAVRAGEAARVERVRLDDAALRADALIFGLRMNEGVDTGEIGRRFPSAGAWDRIHGLFGQLAEAGLLWREEGRVGLTRAGRLVCDAIGAEILDRA